MMTEEQLARLQRLGVVKGVGKLKTALSRPESPPLSFEATPENSDPTEIPAASLETAFPGGKWVETSGGRCFVLDHVYPLAATHGTGRVGELLAFSPADLVPYLDDERLADMQFRDFLFLDIETNGLSGAGTFAFLVGLAFYEGEALVVRQLFLDERADEPALLNLLDELLADRPGLITFNGRAFDLRLLEMRYLMNRRPADLLDRPHLDLLLPARRLWRHRFSSCALGSLENRVLNMQRHEEDIPGAEVPRYYHAYLLERDPRYVRGIIYHNQVDMLSMTTLAAELVRRITRPDDGDHPLEMLGLGNWQVDLGLWTAAENNLRRAAVPEMPTADYHLALHRLGWLLKRQERRREAVDIWMQMATTSFADVRAHVELAKHYEWQEQDVYPAIAWTTQALSLVRTWSDRQQAEIKVAELQHRLDRLLRKLEAAAPGAGEIGADAEERDAAV
jgi:uncharacterized protein YprB with RNaseH-like and TPR domain